MRSEVAAKLAAAGIRVETDLRNEKINYKVREHSLAKVPALLVVGKREAEEGTVAVRRLGSQGQEMMTLAGAGRGADRGGGAAGSATKSVTALMRPGCEINSERTARHVPRHPMVRIVWGILKLEKGCFRVGGCALHDAFER